MTLTAAEIMQFTAAGNAVRFRADGTVSMIAPLNGQAGPMTGAERARRHRASKKPGNVTNSVTPEPGTVTNVTPVTKETKSPLSPSPPSSPSPFSPTPPLTSSSPSPTPSHPTPGADSELFPNDSAPTPKAPKPKKEKAPKAQDPRHHEITSQIGALYRDAMKETPAFNGAFYRALSTFLPTWKDGTADDFLDRYWDVLTLSKEPFAPLCRKAADPEFLCRNWQSVAAEVQKLRRDHASAFTSKPIFSKTI